MCVRGLELLTGGVRVEPARTWLQKQRGQCDFEQVSLLPVPQAPPFKMAPITGLTSQRYWEKYMNKYIKNVYDRLVAQIKGFL